MVVAPLPWYVALVKDRYVIRHVSKALSFVPHIRTPLKERVGRSYPSPYQTLLGLQALPSWMT
jgi:hypothetical protein